MFFLGEREKEKGVGPVSFAFDKEKEHGVSAYPFLHTTQHTLWHLYREIKIFGELELTVAASLAMSRPIFWGDRNERKAKR